MSVQTYRRKEGKFEVLNKALELCVYTLKITANQKIFLPEYENSITNDIKSAAKKIYIEAWNANNVAVRTEKTDYDRRAERQANAIEACTDLLAYIGMAKRVFHLKEKRMAYWTDMIVETRSMLRAWKESDKQRYKEILGL